MTDTTILMGVPIDAVTMSSAIDRIDRLVLDGRHSRRSHQVATVNVDFLVNALDDSELMSILQHSSLNLADGAPIVWASRLTPCPVPERVAGADLVPALVAAATTKGWRIHFFGGSSSVATRALHILAQRHPEAQVTHSPAPFIDDVLGVDQSTLDRIAEVDADILCVALGNPKQEHFIHAHKAALGCPVQIGIGGSLDLLVGAKRRAPRWLQHAGGEWLFRALQEPRRLGKRYARDIRVFIPALVRYLLHARRQRSGAEICVIQRGEVVEVVRREKNASPTRAVDWATADVLRIDASDLRSLTPAGHLGLIDAIRKANAYSLRIEQQRPTNELWHALSGYGTQPFFENHTDSVETRIPCGPDAQSDETKVI